MKKGDKRITYADRQKIEAMERTGAKVTDIASKKPFNEICTGYLRNRV